MWIISITLLSRTDSISCLHMFSCYIESIVDLCISSYCLLIFFDLMLCVVLFIFFYFYFFDFFFFFFFKQKTAYEMELCLEFRRVLFRSLLVTDGADVAIERGEIGCVEAFGAEEVGFRLRAVASGAFERL